MTVAIPQMLAYAYAILVSHMKDTGSYKALIAHESKL